MSSEKKRTIIALDLKAYYASVECVERHLDPLRTNLVVADPSRTEKTICLAVSPSLKAYGIPGRARLFEVIQKVRQINAERRYHAPGRAFTSKSFDADRLAADPAAEIDFIIAPPQMRKYMDISTFIYRIYLKFVSSEDIHVYSIDECFMDVTDYLFLYQMSPRELCMTMIREVLRQTGITAAGGIGTNMFLAKIAMDIVAKHAPADRDGVRIAELDETGYRKTLWSHEPITDFWRIGRGTARKLAAQQIRTMGDIARVSIGLPPIREIDPVRRQFFPDGRCTKPDGYYNEKLLYRLFGVNAELLIDHAWGHEPATIRQIKAYIPENRSISSGQVLSEPYPYEKAEIIVKEMTDAMVLSLAAKGMVTDQIVLQIGYDVQNPDYDGPLVTDHYGRKKPKSVHGSVPLGKHCSSAGLIMKKTLALYAGIADPRLKIRRITIAANNVMTEQQALEIQKKTEESEQLSFFVDYEAREKQKEAELARDNKEKHLQQAILAIHSQYGKNAILKGTSYLKGATGIQRNGQVGGHKG